MISIRTVGDNLKAENDLIKNQINEIKTNFQCEQVGFLFVEIDKC